MTGMEVLAISAMATSAGATFLGAQSQARAAEQDAELKRLQANEMMDRLVINEQSMAEQAAVDETHIEGIGAVLNYRKILQQNVANNRREAEFKARMLRMGADIEESQAGSMRVAGAVSAGGTLLSAGVKAYSLYKGPTKSSELYTNQTPMVPTRYNPFGPTF